MTTDLREILVELMNRPEPLRIELSPVGPSRTVTLDGVKMTLPATKQARPDVVEGAVAVIARRGAAVGSSIIIGTL